MLARNSQGLLVSLLSPNPTNSEVEDRSQSWGAGEGAHKYDLIQGAHLKDEDRSTKEEVIENEEHTEDGRGYLKPRYTHSEEEEVIKKEENTENEETKILKPSDIACKSAEYDEKTLLHGSIDLRYYYNMARDPNSLSTGRNTSSTEPGSIGQATNDAIEVIQLPLTVSWSSHSLPFPSPAEYCCQWCGHTNSTAHSKNRHILMEDSLLFYICEMCERRGVYEVQKRRPPQGAL